MPLEGHWERQRTPLRGASPRERRALVPVVLVMVLALAVVLYATLHHGSSKVALGCLDVTAASTTGGATIHVCGRAASRLCASQATGDDAFARTVQARCRSAGYR